MWLTVGWLGIATVFAVLAYAFRDLSMKAEDERTAILDKAHIGGAQLPNTDLLLPAVADSLSKILKGEAAGFKLATYAAVASVVAAILSAFLP
jgi:hypothetical protein